ncbi:FAD-dependent monooxygenase [Rhodococcus chondri]|uniref:FAD-dependent monooxygenase n=1 Tax=Rhodococcus chondri TaxID=3065941 RepID=A0ABU7JLJ1_9NOCA|nr:FAD-dependent monooxygenase [Rhodococcus sp. CC-R104]MEE2030905.1 FAD-dependent monooxygenase [Rhodococcus sp. CC-R104]
MRTDNPGGERCDVLVAGAGPTGLAVALAAHDHGASVRVVDCRSRSPRPSRAFLVHPRTLEVLRPYGVTGALLDLGHLGPRMHVHLNGQSVSARLGDFRLADTAYPHFLLARQADVEAVLGRALGDRGVAVEWDTRVQGYEIDSTRNSVVTHCGAKKFESRYLVGCDGRSSTVRTAAGIDWRGGRYRYEVLLADVDVTDDVQVEDAHVFVGRRGLVFLLPLGERARWRLVATAPPLRSRALAGDMLPQTMLDDAGASCRVVDVAWSERVSVEHRLAARFRNGPVFLAGDAAHAYSPAGGQGMNAGLQDAANLGWKLAFATRGSLSDDSPLLRSYEQERRSVARRVLALTRLLHWVEAGRDPLSFFARGAVSSMGASLLPLALRQRRLEARAVRLLSQLRWNYRRSILSIDGGADAPGVASAGERLPDEHIRVEGGRCRLHELTAVPAVHVLLCRDAHWPTTPPVDDELVKVHRILGWSGTGVVIVRPDGYVGFRGADSHRAGAWLRMVGVGSASSSE